MPLQLPNLDDRTYADLVAEARSRLPAYCPEWTNHNASDPGIMLVELFAWLTEMLLYRADRVPQSHKVTFLKLLRGPDWTPGKDVDEDVRATVLWLRQPWRAVTAADYKTLALAAMLAWPDLPTLPDPVRTRARAHCLPRCNLDTPDDQGKTLTRQGHVSVILVPPAPDSEATPTPSDKLLAAVAADLEPRRLLTTRLHVVGPTYPKIGVRVSVVRRPTITSTAEELKVKVTAALAAFLHPLKGGPAKTGWPFGGAVYVSDLYPVLQAVPGVASITSVDLDPDADGLTTPMKLDGDALIGLALRPHHLPAATVTVDVPAEGANP